MGAPAIKKFASIVFLRGPRVDKNMARAAAFSGGLITRGVRKSLGVPRVIKSVLDTLEHKGGSITGTAIAGRFGKSRVFINRESFHQKRLMKSIMEDVDKSLGIQFVKSGTGPKNMREIIHHETFHTLPVLGRSEILAHFYGGLRNKKRVLDPIEGVKQIKHFVGHSPKRAAIEAGVMGGSGAAGAIIFRRIGGRVVPIRRKE
jgi:hypothetical protein